jgi:aquaporin Z
VATSPGPAGQAAAFGGELVISSLLMTTVLLVSATRHLARFTGAAAATLVALFIVVEAPLSGMSMNPARTLGSALFAHSPALWIYFTAPPLGMLVGAEVFLRVTRHAIVRCAKLHHTSGVRCIFHCGYLETA